MENFGAGVSLEVEVFVALEAFLWGSKSMSGGESSLGLAASEWQEWRMAAFQPLIAFLPPVQRIKEQDTTFWNCTLKISTWDQSERLQSHKIHFKFWTFDVKMLTTSTLNFHNRLLAKLFIKHKNNITFGFNKKKVFFAGNVETVEGCLRLHSRVVTRNWLSSWSGAGWRCLFLLAPK